MGNTLTPHVERYLNERQRRGLSPSAARNIRYNLKGLDDTFGLRPITSFGPAAVERWAATIHHQSPGTRRAKLSAVRGFCHYLRRHKLVRNDPMETIDPKDFPLPRRVPRAFTAAEQHAALAACPDARARAIVHLELGCGLRACEVSRLQVGDWDRGRDTLRVVGKGGHEREVPVHPAAKAALEAYLLEAGDVHGPLIRSTRDGVSPMQPKSLSVLTSRWLYAAGVKRAPRDGKSGHCYRHSAISAMLDADPDVRTSQEFAGHARIDTTMIYSGRVGLARQRAAMAKRDYTAPPLDAA